MSKRYIYVLLIFVTTSCKTIGQNQRSMFLNPEELALVKSNLGNAPIFDKTLTKVKDLVDKEIEMGSDVPIPKDMAGGYTHQTHKINYLRMEQAGSLFKITGEEKYGKYVKDMLFKYAELFPTLARHPVTRSYSRGKLFWQCLNDSNWLVSVSQAYANIKESLSSEEKKIIEDELLIPYAEFLSVETPQFFNRIHNHSTWGCAAVGMAGLAMGNQRFVDYALYGLPEDDIAEDAHDNDGALIKSETKGFLAQIDGLFSPDGLYSEGPYYHRYAIYPFLVFAVSLENSMPELGIFKYGDGALLKSVNALLAESNMKGEFFPINDAQKGMSIYNPSLIAAVDIAYKYGGEDSSLLSVADTQDEVLLDGSGMAVALNIKNKTALIRESVAFRDGKNGELGGLAILRTPNTGQELLFKYGSQGMGHGHFDKLSFAFYQNGEEVVQDYGMARFVNIEQKGGGGYLKENTTFAKQTVAHNTLVVNEHSHSGGNTDVAEKHAPSLNFKEFSNKDVQGISAKDVNSYPDLEFSRSLFLVDESVLGNSLFIDIMKVKAEKENQYDIPLYYKGQWIDVNFDYTLNESLSKLGTSAGYQHIWNVGSAKVNDGNPQFTWLNEGKFYTRTSIVEKGDEFILGRIGATDPELNLRRDAMLITRRNASASTFVNIIESHGSYSPVNEKTIDPYGVIKTIKTVKDSENYTVILIETKTGKQAFLAMANKNFDQKHTINIGQEQINWDGPFILKKVVK